MYSGRSVRSICRFNPLLTPPPHYLPLNQVSWAFKSWMGWTEEGAHTSPPLYSFPSLSVTVPVTAAKGRIKKPAAAEEKRSRGRLLDCLILLWRASQNWEHNLQTQDCSPVHGKGRKRQPLLPTLSLLLRPETLQPGPPIPTPVARPESLFHLATVSFIIYQLSPGCVNYPLRRRASLLSRARNVVPSYFLELSLLQ